MYENVKMRPVDTIIGMGRGERRRKMEGVDPTMICYKNFCKYHNVSLVQQ
jgi:hypothetical protein